MALSKKEKLEMCLKIWRYYQPMADEAEKWHDSLPHGVEIDYPFDEQDFFREVLLQICGVNADLLEDNEVLYNGCYLEEGEIYDEAHFIEDITALLNNLPNE